MFLWIVLGWVLDQLSAPAWVWVLFWTYIIVKVLYFIYE